MATKNTVKIQKIGNSNMITLTKDIMSRSKLKIGDEVMLDYNKGQIILEKEKIW